MDAFRQQLLLLVGPTWYDILGALLALFLILGLGLLFHLFADDDRERWINQVTNRYD